MLDVSGSHGERAAAHGGYGDSSEDSPGRSGERESELRSPRLPLLRDRPSFRRCLTGYARIECAFRDPPMALNPEVGPQSLGRATEHDCGRRLAKSRPTRRDASMQVEQFRTTRN